MAETTNSATGAVHIAGYRVLFRHRIRGDNLMVVNAHDGALFELAKTVFDDARAGIKENPGFVSLLDLAIAAAEFRDVLGGGPDPATALNSAIDLLKSFRGLGPWLYGGAAHVGWTAFRISRLTGKPVVGLRQLDEMILGWLVAFPDEGDVDLPSGLLGLGVYALGHPDPAIREKMTSAVLDVIEQRVESDESGGLFTRVVGNDLRRRTKPHMIGHRDLGVAHGAGGLVAYLGSVVASDAGCAHRAARLLDGSLQWLLRQRGALAGTVFPHTVEARYEPSRSAWCYGDPGMALALRIAGEAIGSEEVLSVATEAAEAAIARPPARAGVVDPGLCHGAAGLVWFGRRMVDLGAGPAAARYLDHWTEHIRQQRADGELHYLGKEGNRRGYSILEGDLGVALALLYAATGEPPAWEERMLARPVLVPSAT